MLELLVATTGDGGSSIPVVVAVVSALGGIAATIVTQLFIRSKTTAEAGKTAKEGDSSLMDSASNFVAQTGEFGTKLMERITHLEAAVQQRDVRINSLERELHEFKIEITRYEAQRAVITDLRTELTKARERAKAAEHDVAKLEAIIVAAQVQIKGDPVEDEEIMARHRHLKQEARRMREEQVNGRDHGEDDLPV